MTPARRALLLFLLALGVRLAFLAWEPPSEPLADERTWLGWGVSNLASERVNFSPFRTRLIFHPPLYPYFIALVWRLFGSLLAIRVAQGVAGALLAPIVWSAGRTLASERVGLLAGWMTALFPELVWYSVHYWSEPLFLALLWWAIERLLASDHKQSFGTAIAAGLLWGLACLARETALYFAPVAALFLAWCDGSGRKRAAAFLLTATLVVAPWTWRNWVMFESFVPVSTMGGLNLWQGNSGLSRAEVYQRYQAVPGRMERYRFARDMGIGAILDRQPAWLFEKLVYEMPPFWGVNSFAWIHIRRGAYGQVGEIAQVLAAAVIVLPYLAVLALGVIGAARAPADRAHLLLAAFFLYYVALHVITYGYSRFRVPLMPLFFLLAAEAWVAWRDSERLPMPRARRILGLVLAGVLTLCVLPSLTRLLFVAGDEITPEGVSAPEDSTAP